MTRDSGLRTPHSADRRPPTNTRAAIHSASPRVGTSPPLEARAHRCVARAASARCGRVAKGWTRDGPSLSVTTVVPAAAPPASYERGCESVRGGGRLALRDLCYCCSYCCNFLLLHVLLLRPRLRCFLPLPFLLPPLFALTAATLFSFLPFYC